MIENDPAENRRFVDRRASGLTREWQELIESQLEKNTALTSRLASDTQEVVEFFRAGKEGLRVLGWLGKAVKYVAPIGVSIAAIVAAYHKMKGS
jgi:hypothetical protein